MHLARFRQTVVRVSLDAPLSNIFSCVCDKLKLEESTKKHLEFRHPTNRDVTLNLDLSLNHYNLRDVYLTEKPGR